MAEEDIDEDSVLTGKELDGLINQLFEKRAQTREEAFKEVNKTLRKKWCREELLEGRIDTLVDFAVKAFKRGSPTEVSLASEMCELISLTIGKSQRFFESLAEPLTLVFMSRGGGLDDTISSPAAIRALGTICAFSSVEPSTFTGCSSRFRNFLTTKHSHSSSIISSAIESWNLLRANLDDESKRHSTNSQDLEDRELMISLLESPDVEVRIQAGYSFGLFYDEQIAFMRSEGEIQSEEEAAASAAAAERNGEEVSKAMKNGTVSLEDFPNEWCEIGKLKGLIGELSSGSNSHNKAQRIKEQPIFKQLFNALFDGVVPNEILSVKFQQIEFRGWAKILRLLNLRRVISTGLLVHLEQSDVIEEQLHIRIDRDAVRSKMSSTQKRLERSPCSERSKSRSKDLRKSRDSRSAYNEQFLDDS